MASTLAALANTGAETACAMHFLKRSKVYDTEKPYYFSGALEEDQIHLRTNLDYDIHHGINVRDLRGSESLLTLEKHGFELFEHEPKVNLIDPDEEHVKSYLEDLAKTVRDRLNAEDVLAYSYRFRREKSTDDKTDPKMSMGTYTNQDKPVTVPHTDQTREGGLRRVRRHLTEEEAAKYLDGNRRIRIVNCWRPINNTADERPLAMCDYCSVDERDLRSADRASREYVGEIYYVHHNPKQSWYWISGQTPEEVLLFVNFDTKPGSGVPFMVHASFFNEDLAGRVARRESLETALIVISKD